MNAVMETPDRVSLYYREGSSDKVYQAAIEPAGKLFVVNFAYGRRGATLMTGTKTSSPVDYDSARSIFDKLVKEKKNRPKRPYTEGENGTPYQHTDKQPSGILPQLLNPVEEAEVEALLRDDDYCAQEKFDGRHLLVRKQDEHIEGINKKGLLVGLPGTVADELCNLSGSFIPDGESIGDDYHVFDLLEWNGENLRSLPYRKRRACLMERCWPVHSTTMSGSSKPRSRRSRRPSFGNGCGGKTARASCSNDWMRHTRPASPTVADRS